MLYWNQSFIVFICPWEIPIISPWNIYGGSKSSVSNDIGVNKGSAAQRSINRSKQNDTVVRKIVESIEEKACIRRNAISYQPLAFMYQACVTIFATAITCI